MEFSHLQNAVAVADFGSISAAARHLYLGQPSLSKSIKELEREVGQPLFRRSVRGVEPTQAGQDFLVHARSIVSQMQALSAQYQPQSPSVMQLSVYAPPAEYAAHACFQWVQQTNTAGCRITLQYRETDSSTTLEAVCNQNAHLGIVRYPSAQACCYEALMTARGLNVSPLWDFQAQALLSVKHPLSCQPLLHKQQLASFPEISHSRIIPLAPAEQKLSSAFVFVNDRASLVTALHDIANAYSQTEPLSDECCGLHGLCNIPCDDFPCYRDSIIWNSRSPAPCSALLHQLRLATRLHHST